NGRERPRRTGAKQTETAPNSPCGKGFSGHVEGFLCIPVTCALPIVPAQLTHREPHRDSCSTHGRSSHRFSAHPLRFDDEARPPAAPPRAEQATKGNALAYSPHRRTEADIRRRGLRGPPGRRRHG